MITENIQEIYKIIFEEKILERKNMKNKEQNRNYKRFSQRRTQAKVDRIEFTISMNDLSYPVMCPLLGIPIHYHSSYSRDNWPSIDRIDNSKGYIPGNVWIISSRANRIKSDSNPGELMQIALNLRKKIKEIS